jgi:hypothetical protein
VNADSMFSLKFFEPVYPRKYLTVFVLGHWEKIIRAKTFIEESVAEYYGEAKLQEFYQFTSAQIVSHIMKNTSKFLHL